VYKLESIQSRMYDDYTANSILRRSFRGEKKALNETRAHDDDLRNRLSLQTINLLPESKDDRVVARHLSRMKGIKNPNKEITLDMIDRPLLDKPSTSSAGHSRDAMTLLDQLAMGKKRTATDAFSHRSEMGASSGLASSTNLKRQQKSLGIVLKKSALRKNEEDVGDDIGTRRTSTRSGVD